jgi:hypothetical protein
MLTDDDDLISLRHVDFCNDHLAAEDGWGERNAEVFLDHAEEAARLLRFAIGIDRCFFDHAFEPSLADLWRLARCRLSQGSLLRRIHADLAVLIISQPQAAT